jgi:hypothetical protein
VGVGEVAVEQGTVLRKLPAPDRLGRQAEVLVDEGLGRVEVEETALVPEVRDPARVVACAAVRVDLDLERRGDEQAADMAGDTELLDRAQPEFGLGPVAAPRQDGGRVTEVVGTDAHDHELGAEPVAIFEERVIVLLGRVADVARVEDGDRRPEGRLERAPEVLRRRFVVRDQQTLHERVTKDQASDRRLEVGFGAAAAPGVGRLIRFRHDRLTRRGDRRTDLIAVRQQCEADQAPRQRGIAEPERAGVRSHPVGTAALVGLEHLGGEHQGPVDVRPPEQNVIRGHARRTEDPAQAGRSLALEERPVGPAGLVDPVLPPHPQVSVDLLAARPETNARPDGPHEPAREHCHGVPTHRRSDQETGHDERGQCENRRLEAPLEPLGTFEGGKQPLLQPCHLSA